MFSRASEGHPTEAIVTSEPIFDIHIAELAARESTEFLQQHIRFPLVYKSLQDAITLGMYNYRIATGNGTYDSALISLWEDLLIQETKAHDPANPLAPAGIENETATKIFSMRDHEKKYATLFDALGLPRNRVNIEEHAFTPFLINYWEFGLYPSNAMIIQGYTLNELVNGKFIPTLIAPTQKLLTQEEKAELIRLHLSNELLSLHLNIGIPEAIAKLPINEIIQQYKTDFLLLSMGLTLAYTSLSRMKHRNLVDFYRVKNAVYSIKEGYDLKRLELTALELAGIETYEIMYIIQLVASSMFQDLSNKKATAGQPWRNARERIASILEPATIFNERELQKFALNELKETATTVIQMQQIFTQCVEEFKAYI